MTLAFPGNPAPVEAQGDEIRLDVVVPFTTPRFTQDALDAANRLGANLHVRIRLVRVVIVPYPLNLNEPPVPSDFLRGQMEHFTSDLPAECEIRLARDAHTGLMGSLKQHSVVILATKKRPWRTRNERLARVIRRAGHSVVMVEAIGEKEAEN